MSDNNAELAGAKVSVSGVLEKFDGDALPENLVEKVFIENDTIVKVEFFEAGVKVGEQIVEEGGTI